ncbi:MULTISPECIES: MFS transporter [Bacillus]|uniref:MFS transporter n=1 Tax=Bacillus cereus TaxID=1396 RepID=A0AAN5XLR6_BACCE|nr:MULTISPECIES: MFS transporter [Bacillus cereus group]KAB2447914.1 MFS transporter [Bacillus cereus]KAB2484499.1 MFS transporter [Bacillus cereus]MCU4957129.1 MFS transporter [Bacillus cereus]PHG45624.1 MFS transporter [Bacillus wiedmannii]
MAEKAVVKEVVKERLWTPSFLILWQGQFFSTLGDSIYSLALGFWVLSITGSTALMGTLMAASTLPGILISPFAGVLVDRYNRKKLLIITDVIRGCSIVLVALAAYMNLIAIWMVFVVAIVLSICGAIFRPGVNSSLPDMVPKSRITNASSALSMVLAGSTMIGNAAGGYLFQILGAPILFFLNGISYLVSGFSIGFIRIPKVERKNKQHFLRELRDGLLFVWNLKGLRFITIINAILNFFFNVAFVLLLPLFQKTSYLGASYYGIVMACFMCGAMAGFLFLSILKIPPHRKFIIFIISSIIMNVCLIFFPYQSDVIIMSLLAFVAGIFNSAVNALLMSSVQIATPQEMRGKVLAFVGMVTQGLAPFAMALGGVLGDFLPLKTIISTSFLIIFVLITPFLFNKSLKKFINSNSTLTP